MEGYIGEIRLFPKTWLPKNWIVCDGSDVSFKDYDLLSVVCGVEWPKGYKNGDDVDPNLFYRLPNLESPSEDVHYIICYRGQFPSKY